MILHTTDTINSLSEKDFTSAQRTSGLGSSELNLVQVYSPDFKKNPFSRGSNGAQLLEKTAFSRYESQESFKTPNRKESPFSDGSELSSTYKNSASSVNPLSVSSPMPRRGMAHGSTSQSYISPNASPFLKFCQNNLSPINSISYSPNSAFTEYQHQMNPTTSGHIRGRNLFSTSSPLIKKSWRASSPSFMSPYVSSSRTNAVIPEHTRPHYASMLFESPHHETEKDRTLPDTSTSFKKDVNMKDSFNKTYIEKIDFSRSKFINSGIKIQFKASNILVKFDNSKASESENRFGSPPQKYHSMAKNNDAFAQHLERGYKTSMKEETAYKKSVRSFLKDKYKRQFQKIARREEEEEEEEEVHHEHNSRCGSSHPTYYQKSHPDTKYSIDTKLRKTGLKRFETPNSNKRSHTSFRTPTSYGQSLSSSGNTASKQKVSPAKKVSCNCKKSKCLKLYCDCFAAGQYCSADCNCVGCCDIPEKEDERKAAVQATVERNPLAFKPKIEMLPLVAEEGTPSAIEARHMKGCHCKKSACLKKYCECYQSGIGCSEHCKCEGCKNKPISGSALPPKKGKGRARVLEEMKHKTSIVKKELDEVVLKCDENIDFQTSLASSKYDGTEKPSARKNSLYSIPSTQIANAIGKHMESDNEANTRMVTPFEIKERKDELMGEGSSPNDLSPENIGQGADRVSHRTRNALKCKSSSKKL